MNGWCLGISLAALALSWWAFLLIRSVCRVQLRQIDREMKRDRDIRRIANAVNLVMDTEDAKEAPHD
jgi:hypothetical protein